MQKAKKFVAECGGISTGPSFGCGPQDKNGISRKGASDLKSLSDYELEDLLHDGQRWDGNMVCGHWVGTSKASAEVKKEYKRRCAERQKEREARYKEEMARIKAMRAEATRKLNSGQKTTKQSFEQSVWREYAVLLEMAVNRFSSEAKFIDSNIKKYQTIIEKWSKLKNMNKDKITIGKKIVSALKEKSKNLKEIAKIFKQGEGVWWNVSIPIENNKTFEI